MKGRRELKYYINYSDYIQLKLRLKYVAEKDVNAEANGSYKIRSLYFDNYSDKAVVEKLSGLSRREKFRLRFYNDNSELIRLEKKRKTNRLCFKESVKLTTQQCEGILNGKYETLRVSELPLCMELYTKMQYQGLRPRTIVDYTREAFVYRAGNVRITFDSDIRTSNNVNGFFDSKLVMIPASKDMILEIKYDNFLPEVIREAVQILSRNETEFSKYVVSRFVQS